MSILNSYPKNDKTGRYICTSKLPMLLEFKELRWEHYGSREDDKDSDYYIYYKCVDCGHTWKEEMPD